MCNEHLSGTVHVSKILFPGEFKNVPEYVSKILEHFPVQHTCPKSYFLEKIRMEVEPFSGRLQTFANFAKDKALRLLAAKMMMNH